MIALVKECEKSSRKSSEDDKQTSESLTKAPSKQNFSNLNQNSKTPIRSYLNLSTPFKAPAEVEEQENPLKEIITTPIGAGRKEDLKPSQTKRNFESPSPTLIQGHTSALEGYHTRIKKLASQVYFKKSSKLSNKKMRGKENLLRARAVSLENKMSQSSRKAQNSIRKAKKFLDKKNSVTQRTKFSERKRTEAGRIRAFNPPDSSSPTTQKLKKELITQSKKIIKNQTIPKEVKIEPKIELSMISSDRSLLDDDELNPRDVDQWHNLATPPKRHRKFALGTHNQANQPPRQTIFITKVYSNSQNSLNYQSSSSTHQGPTRPYNKDYVRQPMLRTQYSQPANIIAGRGQQERQSPGFVSNRPGLGIYGNMESKHYGGDAVTHNPGFQSSRNRRSDSNMSPSHTQHLRKISKSIDRFQDLMNSNQLNLSTSASNRVDFGRVRNPACVMKASNMSPVNKTSQSFYPMVSARNQVAKRSNTKEQREQRGKAANEITNNSSHLSLVDLKKYPKIGEDPESKVKDATKGLNNNNPSQKQTEAIGKVRKHQKKKELEISTTRADQRRNEVGLRQPQTTPNSPQYYNPISGPKGSKALIKKIKLKKKKKRKGYHKKNISSASNDASRFKKRLSFFPSTKIDKEGSQTSQKQFVSSTFLGKTKSKNDALQFSSPSLEPSLTQKKTNRQTKQSAGHYKRKKNSKKSAKNLISNKSNKERGWGLQSSARPKAGVFSASQKIELDWASFDHPKAAAKENSSFEYFGKTPAELAVNEKRTKKVLGLRKNLNKLAGHLGASETNLNNGSRMSFPNASTGFNGVMNSQNRVNGVSFINTLSPRGLDFEDSKQQRKSCGFMKKGNLRQKQGGGGKNRVSYQPSFAANYQTEPKVRGQNQVVLGSSRSPNTNF